MFHTDAAWLGHAPPQRNPKKEILQKIETSYSPFNQSSPAVTRGGMIKSLLGGGNSNIFGIFTLKIWEDEPIWLICFKWVGSTTNQFLIHIFWHSLDFVLIIIVNLRTIYS